jgi:hypothetical protein
LVPTDGRQRLSVDALRHALVEDAAHGIVPIAVVGIAGTTNTGAIDQLDEIADAAAEHEVWFHVDGAYGLFGVLDPTVAGRFDGMQRADSWAVDMHKWLAIPTGTGATYVRDSAYLGRASAQEPSDVIEGAFFEDATSDSSPWDQIGTPYQEWSLELSAAARGITTWAGLHEIGRDGVRQRAVRHKRAGPPPGGADPQRAGAGAAARTGAFGLLLPGSRRPRAGRRHPRRRGCGARHWIPAEGPWLNAALGRTIGVKVLVGDSALRRVP